MKRSNLSPRRLVAPLAIAAALSACSAIDPKPGVVKQLETTRVGPETAPHRSITSFSTALRCMDNMMVDYGVRDLSMLVEDILDQTKKVNAGTRDMLITAMSEMTRRSRGVRVVAFGRDAFNAVTFLQAAQRQNPYAVVPTYDIKGSVTQWDENVVRNQRDIGIGIQPYLNLGAAKDATASILALDLSVLVTNTMSVLPGVTSRNSVVIFKQTQGIDGDAAYKKFGVNFNMSFNKSEGQSQALRGLVELAVIELIGKLTKTPYWQCLEANPNDEEIKQEIADWFHSMATSQGEIIAWFQNQLRHRRFYEGPIDGRFNPAIDEAIANYRVALGLSKESTIDPAFFSAFLNADHSKIKAPAKPAVADVPNPDAPQAAAPAPQQPSAPLKLALSSVTKRTQFARGEPIDLLVSPSRNAHVYCYLQDETAKIVRFFPNRFAPDSFVSTAKPLALPGSQRFQIVMNDQGKKETVACMATEQDVAKQVPVQVFGGDFEALPVTSLEQIRDAFAKATGGKLAQEVFHAQPK